MSAGLIFAAPKSGGGKTLIVAALLRHLRERGIRAAAAKAGPDYIDPTFHTLASGRPCSNLDPWAMRPSTLSGLIRDLESSCGLMLCEGVMGLFDGTGPDGETGSTAELARLTGWPVVLVVDASGQGASIAALIEGFVRHDPRVPIVGVILNRVASERHRHLLTATIARYLPSLAVLGALPFDDALTLPSRHLGLVPAEEIPAAEALIARSAMQIATHVEIDRLIALAGRATCTARSGAPGLPPLGQHIAVARDDAFLFAYEATLAGWRKHGAAISFFSPLADGAPPADADAIYLPGGYPELHAGRLAAAAKFFADLRRAADMGKPVYGECGGYMALGEVLTDAHGAAHRMAGLLPLRTSFAERRRHLGYRAVRLVAPGPLGAADDRFRGHEFHYASIIAEGDADPLFAVADASGGDLGRAGLRRGSVAGSFIHLIDRQD